MSSDLITKSNKRHQRNCRLCKQPFTGRADKIFSSPTCKGTYHVKLKSVTHDASERIDKILHRNRSILLEIMGKNSTQKKIKRQELDVKKYNWQYITHYHINSQNKFVNYVYDFSWMIFSDQEVLIKSIG
ncbi:MAG: hypothetical protein WAU01_08385 [Saprospiraceae bacterium]